MNYIVDRIEEGIAVCETARKECRKIPLKHLPENLREGDVLCEAEDGIVIDVEATNRRRQEMREKLNALFK